MYKERLKELRETKELTQNDLAKPLDIVGNRYGQYEREYEIMPIKHLINTCNFLDVSVDFIFNLTNEKQYNNISKEINKINAGSRLKEFRKENKLTQKKMATELNTVHQVISKYEKGINLIATPFIYMICKKYNISADYLLGRIDSPKYLK